MPANLPGIEYGKNEVKLGWNSQPTRAISFSDVRIPASYRLGEEGEGFKIAMRGIDGGRINIAACSLGAAQACVDITQRYMRERQQFGSAIAEFQALQFRFADMVTDLVAARQMVRMAAFAIDTNNPEKTVYCAMAKRFATDVGFDVCNQALQLHGGYGYLREYPIERFLRDARVHQILEGTNEVMRVIAARRLLQEQATEVIR
jgi:alkylation response protein AidB-like acyl-CoA dehydrogenase